MVPELHRLASILEDEACDLRIFAEDGLPGNQKRTLARFAAQMDNIAFTIRRICEPKEFDPSKAITDPFKPNS